MPTPLGPGSGSVLSFAGMNVGAAAILKGQGVGVDPTSTETYLEDSIQEDVVPIELFDAGSGQKFIGVAQEDIPAGGGVGSRLTGLVLVMGFGRVLSAGAITAGNGLEPVAASGKFDDSGGALTGNAEVGIALEAAGAADVLVKALLNCWQHDGGLGGA